jgi:hypothetical protein
MGGGPEQQETSTVRPRTVHQRRDERIDRRFPSRRLACLTLGQGDDPLHACIIVISRLWNKKTA